MPFILPIKFPAKVVRCGSNGLTIFMNNLTAPLTHLTITAIPASHRPPSSSAPVSDQLARLKELRLSAVLPEVPSVASGSGRRLAPDQGDGIAGNDNARAPAAKAASGTRVSDPGQSSTPAAHWSDATRPHGEGNPLHRRGTAVGTADASAGVGSAKTCLTKLRVSNLLTKLKQLQSEGSKMVSTVA